MPSLYFKSVRSIYNIGIDIETLSYIPNIYTVFTTLFLIQRAIGNRIEKDTTHLTLHRNPHVLLDPPISVVSMIAKK